MPLSIRASSALDGLRIFEDQRETPGLSVQIDLDRLFLAMRKQSMRQNWGAQSGDRQWARIKD
jgi:hypothetical protein